MKARVILLSVSVFLAACQSQSSQRLAQASSNALDFEQVQSFPASRKLLRQWDAPTIADLDMDGWPDLLLNDHGYSVRIMWNNKGQFEKPYDLVMGDMHGLTVGDINSDGRQEIIVSRGGGSGTNARNTRIFTVSKQRKIEPMADFDTPLALMRGRTVKLVDLDNDGDLDLMNFAFPDREKFGQSENYLYRNDSGEMILANTLPFRHADGQKTSLTDFNGDGLMDFIWFGHGEIQLYVNKGSFKFDNVTAQVMPFAIKYATSITELDFDNDGDMDLFITRGKEFKKNTTFYNAEKKQLAYYTKRGLFNFENIHADEVIQLKNIQSQWPHKSLFLGESAYEFMFPGETHSGRELRLVNSDALGFPDKLIDKGTYVGFVGNGQWRVAGNIWAPSTMVIEGVTQFSPSPSEPGLTNILLENKEGRFVDVSNKHDLTEPTHSTGVTVADIDNNGFVDLVVRNRGRLVYDNKSSVYLNRNGRFTVFENHDIKTTELGAIGLGIAHLDFDLDGDIDLLIGNERGRWHLFENRSPVANYIKLKIGNSPNKQSSALGAKVSLTACGEHQVRLIGHTASVNSLDFNPFAHFGLGQCNEPAEVSVRWSNGETSSSVFSQRNQIKLIGKH